ncbi:MAG: hypothetical protein ACK54F_05215 [Planctomycetia bacterium]
MVLEVKQREHKHLTDSQSPQHRMWNKIPIQLRLTPRSYCFLQPSQRFRTLIDESPLLLAQTNRQRTWARRKAENIVLGQRALPLNLHG